MTFPDLQQLTIRNLRAAPFRNTLTVAAISAGVCALVVMLSFSIGLESMLLKQFHHSGMLDAVLINSSIDAVMTPGTDVQESEKMRPALDDVFIEKLRMRHEVLEAYADVRTSGQIEWATGKMNLAIAGLPPSAKNSEDATAMAGHFFSSDQAAEAIVTRDLAQQIVGPKHQPDEAVGRNVTLRLYERSAENLHQLKDAITSSDLLLLNTSQLPVHVVGVIARDPMGFLSRSGSARVFLPLAEIERLHVLQATDLHFSGGNVPRDSYSGVIVHLSDPVAVEKFESSLNTQHFSTNSMMRLMKGARVGFAVFNAFLVLVSGIAFFISSINIINTMMTAVLERRQEIGIMKAVGASDTQIRTIFLTETATFGFIGGVAGDAAAWMAIRIINGVLGLYLHSLSQPVERIAWFSWWIGGTAILFAISLSLLAGLYPTFTAVRLNPVDALRDRI